MKRAAALLVSLMLVVTLLPQAARAADEESVQRTIRAMGIMVGDQNGDMMLDSPVTRAQFAKMMVQASPVKGSIGQESGVSPFSDVPHTHWSAEYIKTAVTAGYLTGYVDGTFRPDGLILLEEGAAAVLRMLGYQSADLTGSWPTAQLTKLNALSLGDNLTAQRGQALTRRDCMHLFYNLMTAPTKAGALYGQTLGVSLTLSGEIDYSALVALELKGPVVAASANLAALVPFSLEGAEVYRGGALSTPSALRANDVVYYHENLRTVWIYTDKAVGLLTAVLPNEDAPSQVVIGGVSYVVGTGTSAHKLSGLGPYRVGDTVTLLLGRSGEVVDVLDGTVGTGVWYGVVTAQRDTLYTTQSGRTETLPVLEVLCTDGILREFHDEDEQREPGDVVAVTVEKGETTITVPTCEPISGTVAGKGSSIGKTAVAAGVHILDADEEGGAIPLFLSRLEGRKLAAGDIRFYTLNSKGEIEHLILNNATGDLGLYGVITDVQEYKLDAVGVRAAIYQYVIHGQSGTYMADTIRGFAQGPAQLKIDGTSLSSAKAMPGFQLTELKGDYAMTATGSLDLAGSLQVYLVEEQSYTLTQLTDVSNLDRYELTGYTDVGNPLGGQIRIILAEKR